MFMEFYFNLKKIDLKLFLKNTILKTYFFEGKC